MSGTVSMGTSSGLPQLNMPLSKSNQDLVEGETPEIEGTVSDVSPEAGLYSSST